MSNGSSVCEDDFGQEDHDVRGLQEKLLGEYACFKGRIEMMLEAHAQRQSEVIHSHFMVGPVAWEQRPVVNRARRGSIGSEGSILEGMLPGATTPREESRGFAERASGCTIGDKKSVGSMESFELKVDDPGEAGRSSRAKGSMEAVMDDIFELAQLDGTESREFHWPAKSTRKSGLQPSKIMIPPAHLVPSFSTLRSSVSRSVSKDSSKRDRCNLLGMCILAIIRLCDWWNSIREPPRSGRLFSFVYSRPVSFACATVVALNAVYAVAATDYEAEHYLDPKESFSVIVALDLFFIIFYALEILLKLFIHRLYFFCNTHWRWNIFDFILVIFSVVDFVTLAASTAAEREVDLTFMRSLRILKLARVLRIIRMFRLISELRLIMNSVIGSMLSLFWSFMVIVFILYMFGVVFVQFVTTHYKLLKSPMDPSVEKMFGNVWTAMLTLYMCANGGYDWSEVYQALSITGWKNMLVFLVYIIFIQIAVLNIVTGIFVENAMKLAQPDHEVLAQEQHKKVLRDASDLRSLCKEIDADNNGSIALDEFVEAYKKNSKLRAKFAVLGLDINDAMMFFEMLRYLDDDRVEIDVEVFIACCLRLKGTATSIDLHHMLLESRLAQKRQQEFNDLYVKRLDEFADKLADYGPYPSSRLPFRKMGTPLPRSNSAAASLPRANSAAASSFDACSAAPAASGGAPSPKGRPRSKSAAGGRSQERSPSMPEESRHGAEMAQRGALLRLAHFCTGGIRAACDEMPTKNSLGMLPMSLD